MFPSHQIELFVWREIPREIIDSCNLLSPPLGELDEGAVGGGRLLDGDQLHLEAQGSAGLDIAPLARSLVSVGDVRRADDGRLAAELIERSRDVGSIEAAGARVLNADEYAVRANVLTEARRLVGGVAIEQVGTDLSQMQ